MRAEPSLPHVSLFWCQIWNLHPEFGSQCLHITCKTTHMVGSYTVCTMCTFIENSSYYQMSHVCLCNIVMDKLKFI